MDKNTVVVRPCAAHIIGSVIAILATLVLIYLDIKGNPPISMDPEWLLLLCIVALCTSTRSLYVSEHGVCQRYHLLFLNRKIERSRIKCIEIARSNNQYYLLISIDNCPPFFEYRKNIESYKLQHPISLISVPITSAERCKEYADKIKKLYPNLIMSEAE